MASHQTRAAGTGMPGWRLVAEAAAVLLLLTLAGCGSEAPKVQQAPPPAVIVEAARLQDLTDERSFTGRIEAIDKVQIRARVQGFLKERHFEEGAEVDKDELLFEIEPQSFEIAVAQAEASLSSAEASLTLAQQTFDRNKELVAKKAVAQAILDSAQATLMQAKATVNSQQAALENAKLNLSYTRIEAPIHGRVGRTTYSVGNLVGPESDPLVTLVAQDPVYVTFPVPQELLLEVRKAGFDRDSVIVRIRLADGSIYGHDGEVRFAEVQATALTDSVIVRATMPNPERYLVDQQLVTVLVARKKPEARLVVSQSALLLDQQGPYVLAVGSDDKVAIRRIVTGEQRAPFIIVTSGLEEGEKVIVSGHQKVRPGQVVSPQAATASSAKSEGSGQ